LVREQALLHFEIFAGKTVFKNKGGKVGNGWLFFGDRNYDTDFLFREEILVFKNSGILT
jgi:sulfite reductase alpha subunit-like flavoprotein